jgi:hypothetical protein
LAFGTGEFTVEFWFYSLAASGTQQLFEATNNALLPNQWYHIAFTRASGTNRLFVNGTSCTATGTFTQAIDSGGNTVTIGRGKYSGFTRPSTGYFSNVRITKGGALYTSNFNPSTTPFTTTVSAGTVSLLTCQSNRFIDNSVNTFAVTVLATPSVQPFAPFAPQFQYTQSGIGGSGFFDGSGDFLTTPSNAAFSFGTSDFSEEFWIYLTTTPATFQRPLQYSDDRDNIVVESGNFNFFDGSASTISAATTGQWFHLCVTRVGGTLRGFVNGRLGFTRSGTYNSGTRSLALGATSGGANPLGGYTSNYRIVKGGIPSAYSTSSTTVGAQIFTPPTAPFTGSESLTAGSVSLLCNFTNAGIIDGTMDNVLETLGNASVSTSVVKYGSGSLAFDGNGDRLAVVPFSANQNLSFGTGDFTIECWAYFNTLAANMPIISFGEISVSTGVVFYVTSTGRISTYSGSQIAVGTTVLVSANTWVHLAWSRSGTTLRQFVNGVQDGSATNSSSFSSSVLVGADIFASSISGQLNGYIDDLRVTKGVARYLSNFTPPQVALPRQ